VKETPILEYKFQILPLISGGLAVDSGENYKVLSKPLMPADIAKRLVDLSECVKFLEKNNNLLRVKSDSFSTVDFKKC
jgi:hypothetical protein